MDVYQLIQAEVARQKGKWGTPNHHMGMWAVIMSEELGEIARASLEHNDAAFLQEAVQLAAVCVSAIEAKLQEE